MRRADEMERKLKFLETEIKKDGIKMHEGADSPDAPPPREMSDLESTFEKLEQELQEVQVFILFSHSYFPKVDYQNLNWTSIKIYSRSFPQVNQNTEALKKNFLELTELKHILRKTQQFFDEQEQVSNSLNHIILR